LLPLSKKKISKVGGDPSIRKYSKGKMLGKGGFAKCYEFTNLENKKLMAAKIITKASLTKSRSRQKLISEIKIHKSLRHTNIVGFEHVFEDQENVYILLELCTNQSLHDLLKRRKRLTEVEVQCYVVQMISALKYLHHHRVIHRDLKLGNLFLNDKMELKVGDFGLATKLEFDGEKKRTVCGTPNYIAPEVIDGKGGHSYEVDTWSLGVIIYTLLVGKPPFETPDVKLTYKKIKLCNYAFPETIPVSDAAKSLVSRILNLEPSKRPTLDEILQHPFINHGGSIPKLLPVSTLACVPSASYMKQFLPQGNNGNTIKVMLETTPFGFAKPSKLATVGGKPNMMATDRGFFSNKPHSPLGQTQAQTQTQTGETLSNLPNFDRQSSRGDKWGLTRTGVHQIGSFGSTQNLKNPSRPHSVQQKDFKSSQSLKTSGQMNALTTTTGAFSGYSRGTTAIANGEVWVTKWVDYSSKYGLGYLLSNGASGVFFNDSTKILVDPKGAKFDYIERAANDKQDTVVSHSLIDYPKDLQKKVTLLQHFKKYLEGENKVTTQVDESNQKDTVYVKKWLKTKHATMFRLSNKIVQMNFTDKTEIILSSENKIVTYLNKKGERSNYPLSSALESNNPDMAKRLKYTKEVLTHMLGNNQQAQMPTLAY